MIYNENEYKVKFFQNDDGLVPLIYYLDKLSGKERAKILKYIEFLREKGGYLDEPYSKHIIGKIRELRVDINKNRHRIFYFTFIEKTIILLHAFLKKTAKTPVREIKQAADNLKNVINNARRYE